MKIKVIAIVVSPASVVLYKENGEAITIAQGNITSPQLVTQAIEDIKKYKIATIDLTPTEVDEGFCIYQKTSAVAKFFRVAKSYVDKLFGENGTLVPQQAGEIPTPEEEAVPDVEDTSLTPEDESLPEAPPPPKEASKRKHRAAIREIMEKTEETLPTDETSLDASKVTDDNVTVAVVGDTIIPHAEKLQKQVEHAVNTNRTQGMDNLLKRLSVMIHERSHSTEDLVAFLSTGDLPVMDDGSILAYKRVTSTSESGIYVDTHSKKVRQKVGSEVMMDISHVDPSRSKSCSYGLHVATRGYLQCFTGDVILFIKVAPEDAIAVPSYENTKIRVCRYQVIGKASPDMFDMLRNNRPITGESNIKVISNLLAGNHPPMTQRVLLNTRGSSDITYLPITDGDIPTRTREEDLPKETLIKEAVPEEEVKKTSFYSVDARSAVTKKEEVAPTPEPKPESKPTPKKKTSKPKKAASSSTGTKSPSARELLLKLLPVKTKAQAQEALALKRKTKKGWKVLGVSEEDETIIMNLLKK